MKRRVPLIVSVLTLFGFLIQLPAFANGKNPRLILQITVDQLRGDQPTRHAERLGKGGFRYLMQQGVHYQNAHYQHANTETIVGHTSLATGTVPAAHGMVGNVWFDHELGRLVYNIEDDRYRLLSADADVDDSTEIDPTQRVAMVDGRSPTAILTSTFSDEMAIHFGGKSKLFGVSVKDRGAVAMAGHAGKAFWFSKASGEFVTSNYYYDKYPEWVAAWNQAKPAAAFSGKSWTLLYDPSIYLFGDADDRPYETDFPGYGRTFPHPYGSAHDKYFTTRLTLGPAGDLLTLDFAKTLIREEQLGQDEVPDYLAVSFSSTDYIGHIFGPSSLESEDNLLQLDRTLADLFAYVDEFIGLDNTLIVLSADHGGPETPGYLNELGIQNAHYFNPDEMDHDPAIQRLKERFGIGSELITMYSHPYVYLDRELIRDKGLNQADVESAVAAELNSFRGIALAVSSSALASNQLADTLLMRAVKKNYHRKRSGDIYLVFEPNVFINDFDGLIVASTHGSPWRYDTYVPVFFAGHGIKPEIVSRPVTPYDIASTLSAMLGAKPPTGSIGKPLNETLRR
jgi:predicted AlkP superfamily pyrophosphatase or phosphodiesterase